MCSHFLMSADLKIIQRLVFKGMLVRRGHRSGTYYQLPAVLHETPNVGGSPVNMGGREDSVGGYLPEIRDGLPLSNRLDDEDLLRLRALAYPQGTPNRLKQADMRNSILRVCQGRYLTATRLGLILGRDPDGLRDRYLTPMVRVGLLALQFPQIPSHRQQAHRAEQTSFDAETADH